MFSDNRNQHPVPLIPGSGRIIFQDNIIRFDKVPLVTPNGDILVNDLTFEVRSGVNVLVCGPNGCGKSSLFRVLGEVRDQFRIRSLYPLVHFLNLFLDCCPYYIRKNGLMICLCVCYHPPYSLISQWYKHATLFLYLLFYWL